MTNEVSKWEVIWSRNKPVIVYRSQGMFKIFKVTIEEEKVLTKPIRIQDPRQTYREIKRILCEDLNLDAMACDLIQKLYFELHGHVFPP